MIPANDLMVCEIYVDDADGKRYEVFSPIAYFESDGTRVLCEKTLLTNHLSWLGSSVVQRRDVIEYIIPPLQQASHERLRWAAMHTDLEELQDELLDDGDRYIHVNASLFVEAIEAYLRRWDAIRRG